jgi:hypothetical protein
MTEQDKHWQKKTRQNKNDVLLIVDASSLIRMASLMNPHDLTQGAPTNPSLLRFLEHVANRGVKVVIPESTIFETCGHRADGSQLDNRFERDIEYPVLRDFFNNVSAGKIPNISIEKTEFSQGHFKELELLKKYRGAFDQYKRENLHGFGDDDIIKLLNRNEHHGRIYVLTEDRGLSERIAQVKTASGKPASVIDTIAFCDDVQHAAPVPWTIDAFMLEQIKETLNYHYIHDNQKREKFGRTKRNGLYTETYEGFSQLGSGEPRFGKALRDMINFEERSR